MPSKKDEETKLDLETKSNTRAKDEKSLKPLNGHERTRLAELERMARMGRKIDQPTAQEMKELGRLRERAK
jgi:hypothetical protein